MSLNTDLGAELGKRWPRLCFINRLMERLHGSSIAVKEPLPGVGCVPSSGTRAGNGKE